jgi:hypothetical protein
MHKKTRNLVRRVKRKYTHRLHDPKLPSRVLWRSLDEMEVRDSGGSDVIFSFNVTDRRVSDAIREIKSEVVGLDGISIRFLRLI